MSAPAPSPVPLDTARARRGAALLLLGLLGAAYARTFAVPFLLDDASSIVANASLRSWSTAWFPPAGGGETVGGRPLLNASFALNHALGGLHPAGYHAGNLLIHAATTLLLFGLVRRLFRRVGGADAAAATPFAAAVAALWSLHPLATAAVTYVAQRAESFAALWIVLALYAFVRHAAPLAGDRPAPRAWAACAVVACWAGVATKETAVVAPVLVFLCDWLWFRPPCAARCGRRWLHAALCSAWLPLAALVAGTHGRAGSAGWGSGVGPWEYFLTQLGAVGHYLRLALWPRPLVFDYGTAVSARVAEIALPAAVLLALGALVVVALARRQPLGFVGAGFFLLLAPSSSLVPVATQTVAEHRMYLPLVAPVVLVVVALRRWLGRGAWVACGALAVALGLATFARNAVYLDPVRLWRTTAAAAPDNSRAHLNLGVALVAAGRAAEAESAFATAVRLAPADSDARNNLANTLALLGRAPEALPHFAVAVRAGPANWRARANYARVLADLGRWAEAADELAAAVRLHPDPALFTAQARVAGQRQRLDDAADAWRAALRLAPADAALHARLGEVLLLDRRPREAADAFQAALRFGPESADLRARLGAALVLAGRPEEARPHLVRALALDPVHRLARATLARLPPAAPPSPR